jgi:Glycosyl hydrolase family 63 C-terminal domain
MPKPVRPAQAAASTDAAGAEVRRLAESVSHSPDWKRWGTYLAERQWGVVREDYSADGDCWSYFTHDHARSRAYRWGEDGLPGFCDREGRLHLSVALWNERDPILKERLFGLGSWEGNHGEDAKEVWFHLDNTPVHSHAVALYKYPQAEFPYARLVDENRRRSRLKPEFELADTGVFDDGRYFDIRLTFAKRTAEDIFFAIDVTNHGPDPAPVHVLPTLWFRNTWTWGCPREGMTLKPAIVPVEGGIRAMHETLGDHLFAVSAPEGATPIEWLFTENETNNRLLFGAPNAAPWVKDAFHARVVHGDIGAVNPERRGSKAAAWSRVVVAPGQTVRFRCRLAAASEAGLGPEALVGQAGGETRTGPRRSKNGGASVDAIVKSADAFDSLIDLRRREADAYYGEFLPKTLTVAERSVARQACAGLLWSKQFYHFVVEDWLKGDPATPAPPEARLKGRNSGWTHVYARDVIAMPDKWEYPWFAAWDLAFHAVAMARLDPGFAKRQLVLLLREWYMHPNGQLPAYEFAFDDVNPPVHAWAAWRVYKMTGPRGGRDRDFLESVFQKLLLNFTWWVNRKDSAGHSLFSGGFLGLDNIGVFDRSKPLPGGGVLQQADGTAWMAFYCATMLGMAVELARDGERVVPAYEDMASKFLEHFVQIADAMNTFGGQGLWDDTDGFYYDRIESGGKVAPLRTRSLVGLLPLIAVEVFEESEVAKLPGFKKRLDWFVRFRDDLHKGVSLGRSNSRKRLLLAIPTRDRLRRVLEYLGDEREFLSPFGVRSLSKHHKEHPFLFTVDGVTHRVDFDPGESSTWLFGGNSNWRGPVWMPVNYLLIEALERYHHFYGPEFTVEYPARSGKQRSLREVAADLESRLAALFLPGASGGRPCFDGDRRFASDPAWRELCLFHEFFHCETGRGLGASHQTGWTALIARLLDSIGRRRGAPPGNGR